MQTPTALPLSSYLIFFSILFISCSSPPIPENHQSNIILASDYFKDSKIELSRTLRDLKALKYSLPKEEIGTPTKKGLLFLKHHKGGGTPNRFNESLSIPYLTLKRGNSEKRLFDFRKVFADLVVSDLTRLSFCEELSHGAAVLLTSRGEKVVSFSTEKSEYRIVYEDPISDMSWADCDNLYFIANGILKKAHQVDKHYEIAAACPSKPWRSEVASTFAKATADKPLPRNDGIAPFAARLERSNDGDYLIVESILSTHSVWGVLNIKKDKYVNLTDDTIIDLKRAGENFFLLRQTNSKKFIEKYSSLKEIQNENPPEISLHPNRDEFFQSLKVSSDKLLVRILKDGKFLYRSYDTEKFPKLYSTKKDPNCSLRLRENLIPNPKKLSFACDSYEEPIISLTTKEREVPITFLPPYNSQEQIHPTLLVTYGAYGHTITPAFSPLWELLRNNGVAIAVAHIRGGGYFGELWHEEGRGLKKQNGVQDLIEAARMLKSSYSSSLIGYGKSAGGFPILGAHATEPTLFAGIVLEAPIVDPPNQITKNDKFYLRELEEWGDFSNPNINNFYKSIQKKLLNPSYTNSPIYLRLSTKDSLVSYKPLLHWSKRLSNFKNAPLQIIDMSNSANHRGEPSENMQLLYEARIAAFIANL